LIAIDICQKLYSLAIILRSIAPNRENLLARFCISKC